MNIKSNNLEKAANTYIRTRGPLAEGVPAVLCHRPGLRDADLRCAEVWGE